MPTIAGILAIVSGSISILGFGLFFVGGLASAIMLPPDPGFLLGLPALFGLGIVKGLTLALGVLALIGGICAVQRRHWPLALIGSVCALAPAFILGVVAIVLTVVAKGEFEQPGAEREKTALPAADGQDSGTA